MPGLLADPLPARFDFNLFWSTGFTPIYRAKQALKSTLCGTPSITISDLRMLLTHVYPPIGRRLLHTTCSTMLPSSVLDAVMTSSLNTYVRQCILHRAKGVKSRGHLTKCGGAGPLTVYEIICAVEDKARADKQAETADSMEDAISNLVYPDAVSRSLEATGSSTTLPSAHEVCVCFPHCPRLVHNVIYCQGWYDICPMENAVGSTVHHMLPMSLISNEHRAFQNWDACSSQRANRHKDSRCSSQNVLYWR